jgi:hypothetical protein
MLAKAIGVRGMFAAGALLLVMIAFAGKAAMRSRPL